MKVLLIDPGHRYLEKDMKVVKPYPHIGLCYLATYLLSKDIEAKVLDIGAHELNEKEVEEQIRSFEPDIVAITSMTFLMPEIYELSKKIKQMSADIVIVLGGAHPTAVPKLTLEECAEIDVIIRGEGEEVLYNIVKALEKGNFKENLKSISGINFRHENQIVSNPNQEYIHNLDSLPFPDWSLFDYNKYFKMPSKRFDEPISMYQISGSRGCPYTCAFCYPLHGRQVRYRTPENVVNEMQWIFEKFGARHIDFTDSTATVDKERFNKLCNLINERGLNKELEWVFETRVDVINRDILKGAKRAGSELVYFGLESGDDFILKNAHKNINTKMSEDAVRMAVEEGLKVKVSFILGHPYETVESAKRTLEFAQKLKYNYGIDMYFNIIDIYPGTQLFEYVDQGVGGTNWIEGIRNNWKCYNRAAPMIEVNDLDRYKIVEVFNECQAMLKTAPSEYSYRLREDSKNEKR
jgi:radical SAM superfamily enzyme YgiQ (UPF0313 family)